jgi:cell shape-determining protein MreC
VLAGAGAGMMELRFLAANAEVQVGDILVTSGLDGVYLPGLPVAKVVKIDRDSSYSFARITCAPLAGVERHGLALVLGSAHGAAAAAGRCTRRAPTSRPRQAGQEKTRSVPPPLPTSAEA